MLGQIEEVAKMLQASPMHISEAVHFKETAICGDSVAPKRSQDDNFKKLEYGHVSTI